MRNIYNLTCSETHFKVLSSSGGGGGRGDCNFDGYNHYGSQPFIFIMWELPAHEYTGRLTLTAKLRELRGKIDVLILVQLVDWKDT